MSSLSRPQKIGLLGPYGFGNLGDAAIQDAMIQHIRKRHPDAQIFGFSLNPEDTFNRHGIAGFPIGRMPDAPHSFPARIPRHIRYKRWMRLLERIFYRGPQEIVLLIKAFNNLNSFDLLIASGGGQLDDYWGGAWQHPYTLFKWGLIARLRGTRFIFASVGAGPIDETLSRWFIKQALTLAGYRSYRDESSKKFIEEKVKFYRDDPVYPDLAHSLMVTNIHKTNVQQKTHPVVGVGPMAYFDPRIWPEKDSTVFQSYLHKLAKFVGWLLEKQYVVLLFPGEADHDRWVIKDLVDVLNQMEILYRPEQLIIPDICTVDELMLHLSQTDLVIASRFHGVLLPILLPKPVLALSYHNKIDVLMEDTGQIEYCLPIDTFEVDVVIERFTALEANKTSIEKQLAAKNKQYQAALDKQYERIFSQI